ncbi:MAG TPA: NAD(P)-dependent oxidoreductase [Baekduia sp.]
MRIFIAGATGVVGRRVVALLAEAGHELTAMTRHAASAPGLRAAGADPVVCDVFDAGAVRDAVRGARPEVVVHELTDLAAGDRTANAAIRVQGTRNLVDAAHAAGVRRIVAQSIAWAYAPGDAPASEDVPLDTDAADGTRRETVAAVAALESTAAELPEWIVLRHGMLYGPGTWYAPGGLMAGAARAGQLPATADVTSFVHVDDAAAAAVVALDWPTGTYNICDDEPAPGSAWVPAFCQAVDAPPPLPPAPATPRAPWARGADNHRARTRRGWTPRFPTWRTGF